MKKSAREEKKIKLTHEEKEFLRGVVAAGGEAVDGVDGNLPVDKQPKNYQDGYFRGSMNPPIRMGAKVLLLLDSKGSVSKVAQTLRLSEERVRRVRSRFLNPRMIDGERRNFRSSPIEGGSEKNRHRFSYWEGVDRIYPMTGRGSISRHDILAEGTKEVLLKYSPRTATTGALGEEEVWSLVAVRSYWSMGPGELIVTDSTIKRALKDPRLNPYWKAAKGRREIDLKLLMAELKKHGNREEEIKVVKGLLESGGDDLE